MADSDPISDGSVSSKRRKLNNGISQKAYDSGDDSGDSLDDDLPETIATQALPIKPRPYHTAQKPGSSQDQFTYRTQQYSQQYGSSSIPTQPIYRPGQTQPTQAFTYNTQAPDVQVPRSSPPAERPQPIKTPLRPGKGSMIATAIMVPRGNAFRPPTTRPAPPPKALVPTDSDDDDPPPVFDPEDIRNANDSIIPPTRFSNGNRNLSSSPNRITESPHQNDSTSAFASLLSKFHNHDDSISLAPRKTPAPPSTNGQVVLKPRKEYSEDIDRITDAEERRGVERIRRALGQQYPVSWCIWAYRMCGNNLQSAQAYLVDQNNRALQGMRATDELAPTPHKNAAKGIARMVEEPPVPARVSTKQTVETSQTIQQKYGGNHARKVVDLSKDDTDSDSRPKGRRLVRGRRKATPSPERQSESTERRLKPPPKRRVEEDETDNDEDQQVIEEPVPPTFNLRLLKFFNTCSAQEMIDLSGQPAEFVDAIIAARPFRNLDQVEDVPHPTKPRANPIGMRTVEICHDMMKGYDATAELVAECEQLAKPIKAALKEWKLERSDSGELSIAELSNDKLIPQPSNMADDVTLMPHQVVGLNWLHLLWTQRNSCILADDMGLGKTCQIISFLAQLQLEGIEGPHLVVVPASTLENWLREFARFAPSLSLQPYSGSVAEREEAQQRILDEQIDVVITTYHYATNDSEFLRKHLEPVVCVYDEAHQLRNPKTKKYTQTMNVSRKAAFRVLLTGTPLQNNLQELVAILAFIMPGMFKEKKDELELIFKHNAGSMMDGHTSLLSAQRIAKARSMITPFILRRRKAQVIALPAKHRRVEYCEMTESQEAAYEDIREQLRAQRASGKKSTKVGNALMDLRKISIHPLLMRRLYTDDILRKIARKLQKIDYFSGTGDEDFIVRFLDGSYHAGLEGNDASIHRFCAETPELHKFMLEEDAVMDSGKVEALKVLLTKYAKNGDKVLLFSQFVIMLNILEPVMSILGIKYMRLDGSTDTNARQDLIDHFNNSQDTTLFMLSTKAGGAGINLASANKVIIFDTGFNPQDDIQAENRAHRVGQTREVEVVRFVTRGTVEEQLLALGESKLALDERVAGDGHQEDAAAEKANAKKLEEMVLEDLDKPKVEDKKDVQPEPEKENVAVSNGVNEDSKEDLKDAFANQLRDSGIAID